MEFTHFFIMFYVLLASWLICLTTAKPSSASYYPALESFDAIDADNYNAPYAEPITDYRLSRLRRGYYYVDNGYITAVPGSALSGGRRFDSGKAKSAEERQDSYTPLLRYRQQRTKRKKLFVPNLYG